MGRRGQGKTGEEWRRRTARVPPEMGSWVQGTVCWGFTLWPTGLFSGPRPCTTSGCCGFWFEDQKLQREVFCTNYIFIYLPFLLNGTASVRWCLQRALFTSLLFVIILCYIYTSGEPSGPSRPSEKALKILNQKIWILNNMCIYIFFFNNLI